VKVYITKRALTKGIFESEVSRTHHPNMVTQSQGVYYHKPDWHLTLDEAITRAKDMQQRKIASIRKQLAKVEALTW